MSDVDIFDGIAEDTPAPVETQEAVQGETPPADSTDNETSDAVEEAPVETVSSVPVGALSVTDFAAFVTQQLMRDKIAAGEDLDGSEYVVPQAVYQTVKAAKNRIPHILVKAEGDAEPRVYIMRDEALEWWKIRREHIATRGSGATRASNRTPEDNLNLFMAAVEKALYAKDRLAMWTEKVDQASKLLEKKKVILASQEVTDETVALALQEATDSYNKAKAEKEADRAAKAKKSGDAAPADADDNE